MAANQKRKTRTFMLTDSEYAVVLAAEGNNQSEKLRNILATATNGKGNGLSNDKTNGSTKQTDQSEPFLTLKSLRDSLKRCKKASPIKEDLIAVLTAILKDGPVVDSEPLISLPTFLDDDGGIEPSVLERKKRKEAEQKGLVAAGGDMKRIVDKALAKRDAIVAKIEANKPVEDWFPDEDTPMNT